MSQSADPAGPETSSAAGAAAEPSLASPAAPAPGSPTGRKRRPRGGGLFALRQPIPRWQSVSFSLLGVASVLLIWWFLTRGETVEDRILSTSKGLYSPWETFSSFHSLWFDRAFTRNLLVTLRRVVLGFGLAAAVGVPLGVLCGCFPRIHAFFLPMTLFGRNIPMAALIPLTFSLFGIAEWQKIMFIFIASVAFIISDTARAIGDVREAYVDSAFTLGASRWQIILKVLVPLAMPTIFNSMRLLFGLAFGYIMLAEVIKFGGESGGIGDLINISQRRGPREHVLLILLIIPVVALMIDSMLFWIQRELFPYRYGGLGLLHQAVRGTMHLWEDLKSRVWRRPIPEQIKAQLAAGTDPAIVGLPDRPPS
jgi:ABC-type nitrate/sulfonate/bicarbonate transport system permease component